MVKGLLLKVSFVTRKVRLHFGCVSLSTAFTLVERMITSDEESHQGLSVCPSLSGGNFSLLVKWNYNL